MIFSYMPPVTSCKKNIVIWNRKWNTDNFTELWIANEKSLVKWNPDRVVCRNLSPSYCVCLRTWWRHQMETFSALLALCAGNSPTKGQWTGGLMLSLICALNKRLNEPSRGWWFDTPSRSSWRHCNDMTIYCLSTNLHFHDICFFNSSRPRNGYVSQ